MPLIRIRGRRNRSVPIKRRTHARRATRAQLHRGNEHEEKKARGSRPRPRAYGKNSTCVEIRLVQQGHNCSEGTNTKKKSPGIETETESVR
ncbi:hypothetical protein Phum_PHUM205200 [Pediculus humanus corporis]|uniref:Uncharacterized protein n=1 Tax=Pediculus humanus subsp. corporis TaxID=121224 RepID=E0VHC4_PEDHC|nr:uncharacterized protein Phum_PHUM205200 [Pediculus humanus corporis]EEB12780.1 hypothetical protein Phum_PHUM205200 [Pediculus humanus corporis]